MNLLKEIHESCESKLDVLGIPKLQLGEMPRISSVKHKKLSISKAKNDLRDIPQELVNLVNNHNVIARYTVIVEPFYMKNKEDGVIAHVNVWVRLDSESRT